ncbi:hypothetical protein J6590_047078 [Homalodisca vitripennis]|nr:hypothetical protein J6590_047078 [Homalodisca vitripennis]
MFDVIDSNFLVFAYDIKLFNGVGSLEDCLRLQDSLDRICNCCIVNGMQLNAKKCKARFDLHDIMFLFKIINGIINCPELLGKIGFRTPSSTISTDLFVHNFYRTNYMRSGTIARLHQLGNSIPAEVDFFCGGLFCFRRSILNWFAARHAC